MFGILAWAVGTVLGGLFVGALGRLVVPGPNPIGLWRTVLCGIGGSLIGSLLATGLFGWPSHHWLASFVLEVLVAAALVSLLTRRRRSHVA